jgi:hypothetical protein
LNVFKAQFWNAFQFSGESSLTSSYVEVRKANAVADGRKANAVTDGRKAGAVTGRRR